jgi:adenosine deaminase
LAEINAANAVLRTEEDFFEVTRAYLIRAAAENVRYAEIQVAPRDISAEAVFGGMHRAYAECAATHGIRGATIVTLIKSDPPAVSEAVLDAAIALRHLGIVAIGFAAAEVGYPHAQFRSHADRARAAGLRVVSHAGEEGPPSYVAEAVWDLGAERIDHGVRAIEDLSLGARLTTAGVGEFGV